MATHHSALWWQAVTSAYVQGEDGVYPTLEALATRFGVSIKAVEKRCTAGNWPVKRTEWQRATAPLLARQEVERSLKARQASNSQWEVLARAMRNQAAKVLNAAQASDAPMSLEAATGWTRVMKEAQAVERRAAGEVPELVDDREEVEGVIHQHQEHLAKLGGEPLSEQEKLDALDALGELSLSRLLMLWGVKPAPAAPQKAL